MHYIDPSQLCLAAISFATLPDLLKLPKYIFDLFKENNTTPLAINFKNAICSGGVMIQDLPELNIEQIKTISSPEAIALYRDNQFIRAADILNNPPNTSENENGFAVIWNSIFGYDVLNSWDFSFSLLSGVFGALFNRRIASGEGLEEGSAVGQKLQASDSQNPATIYKNALLRERPQEINKPENAPVDNISDNKGHNIIK